MKKSAQKRIALLVEARNYAEQMKKGSVFVTDFQAVRLIERLTKEIQNMLAENLKLEEVLKYDNALKKAKKDLDK